VFELPDGLHGAHRRTDLVALLGLPAVRALVRDGFLVRYSRNVLVDRRRMLDLPTRAGAALLHVGPRSVLTSHTAALIYGCTAADPGAIHVLGGPQRSAAARPGLVLHIGDPDPSDLLELDGLRVLGLEAVIADLLCTADRPLALACADQALATLDPGFRLSFRTEVDTRLRTRTDLRTARGTVLLELASGLPESPAESAMLLALYDAGLPIPVLQHSVRDISGRERYRLDFAWPQPRVALEYDGRDAHEHRALRDATRDADLRSRGWLVFHATAPDLHDPTRLIAALRPALMGIDRRGSHWLWLVGVRLVAEPPAGEHCSRPGVGDA
jgi:hypothetical protein